MLFAVPAVQVGHDIPVVVGLVVLLLFVLERVGVLEHLVLALPYLIFTQLMLYFTTVFYLFIH